METMYITEGEIHAQVNLTDEEYKELQRLIELEMNPLNEDMMPTKQSAHLLNPSNTLLAQPKLHLLFCRLRCHR
jgi:hypothetical protein